MHYPFFALLGLCLLFSGCAGLPKAAPSGEEALARVLDGLPLRVIMNASLSYVGEAEAVVASEREPTKRTYRAQVFVRADAERRVLALAVVERGRIAQGIWLDATGNDLSRHRYTGSVGAWIFQGLDGVYCGNDYYVERFLLERGYLLSDCWLYDMRSGLFDAGRTDKLSVQYAEPVADAQLADFFGALFREKKMDVHVQAFAERAGQTVRLLPAEAR